MRWSVSYGLVCAVGLATLGYAATAQAADGGTGGADGGASPDPGTIVAAYCGDADMQCVIAPVTFYKKVQLPIAFEWTTAQLGAPYDTNGDGWVSDDFTELQIFIKVAVPAETVVKLSGQFKTTWPQALTLAVPGERYAGLLKFDYGLILEALAKIDVDVLGYHVGWQGPIPYVPQIDFHLLGGTAFDPWVFNPDKVSASAFTAPLQLFQVNLLGLANIPSQVAEGGIELKLKGELKAYYHTDSIKISSVGSAFTPIADITTQNGLTQHNFLGGDFVEYDVHPEGDVHYDGIIHLMPYIYVKILGHEISLPVYDFKVPIPIGDQAFTFDALRVHVPLPNVPQITPVTYDFGDVPTGDSKLLSIPIMNVGEAKARAYVEAADKIFKVLKPTVFIDPNDVQDIDVRFQPKKKGPFHTTLTVSTNDPDLPVQTIELTGNATPGVIGDDDSGSEDPDADLADGATADGGSDLSNAFWGSGQNGGCGCRTAPASQQAQSLGWLAALGLAGALRRRARRNSAR